MPAPQADPKPTPPKRAPKATPAPAEAEAEKEVPTEETKPQKPVSVITVEELRAKVQEVAMSGKRAEVKDLLTEFGAANVSALDPDKYDEFLVKLKAL